MSGDAVPATKAIYDISQARLITLGIDPMARACLLKRVGEEQLVPLSYDLDKLMDATAPEHTIGIFCGTPPADIPITEIAQLLATNFVGIPLYYVASARAGFDHKLLKKNGFQETFLLPIDSVNFDEALTDRLNAFTNGKIRSFRSVQLIDLAADSTLEFDTFLFLPLNNKYIRYSASGQTIGKQRSDKLTESQVANVFIKKEEMASFYKFTAQQLKKVGSSKTISETEKREKMQGAVRDLLSGLFTDSKIEGSFDDGREVLNDCKEIVKSYIVGEDKDKSCWYEKIVQVADEPGSPYTKASKVASLAALFSMATGIGDPEELAMAGILHHIGLIDLPAELQNKDYETMSPEEKAVYQKHPELSVEIIKKRKMIISDNVAKAILQHHEKYSGTGYPKGLAADRIKPEAQVLAFADLFVEMTAPRAGHARLLPLEVLRKVSKENSENPGSATFDPSLLKKLSTLFPVKLAA